MSLKVTDPVRFVRNFVPATTVSYSFDDEGPRRQILSEFVQSFIVAINSLSNEYRISQLLGKANDIAACVRGDRANAGTWNDRFGFEVFSVGIEPSSGPSLVFITLPGIFNSMPLSMVWSSVFFLLLVVAALTSTISLHEVITAYMHEEWLGVLKGWNIFGLTIFDSLDYLTANILLPAGGFFTCIFVGWRLDRKILKAEISNNGTLKFRIYGVFIFLVRYVCPAVLLLIFLDNLGLF